MPKLPDASQLGERPQPTIGRIPRNIPAPSRAGEIVGQSVSKLGMVVDQIDREMERIDTLRAEEAFNSLREKQLELSSGEEGFSQKKGSDAVNNDLFKEYGKRFTDAEESIASTLKSQRQRDFFGKRSQIAGLEFKHQLLNHVTREKDAYAKQVFESTVKLETNNAINMYGNTSAVSISKERINSAITGEAERNKWSEEQTQLARQNVESNLNKGIIMRMLANDNDIAAMDFYGKNANQVHGDDKRDVEQALVLGSTRGESQRQADQIVAKTGGDLRLAMIDAKRIKNPRIREATESRIKTMISDNEAGKRVAREQVHASALEYIQEFGTVDKIPPDVFVLLSKDDINMLERIAKAGPVKENDNKASTDFFTKARDRNWLTGLTDIEFGNWLTKFDEPNQERASALRDAAKSAAAGDAKAAEFLRNDVNLGEMVKTKMMTAGVLDANKKPSKYSDEERIMLSDIEVKASKALEDFQSRNKRKATTSEEEEIVKQLVIPYTKVKIERNWMPDTTKELGELTPEELQRAYVKFDQIPMEERDFLKNRARQLGVQPTDDAIAKAYTVLISSAGLPAADRRSRIDAILRSR